MAAAGGIGGGAAAGAADTCVIGTWKAFGYSLIAPVAASTSRPIIPPKRILPTVQPWKLDGIVATASCQPALVHRTWISSLLFSTVTEPGELKIQFPSLLDRLQSAPVVGGVATLIDCDDPFMIEA